MKEKGVPVRITETPQEAREERTDRAPPGSQAHSFVVRLWREGNGEENRLSLWRGTIDHIGTGSRHHFSELEGIVAFIRRRAIGVGREEESFWKRIVKQGRRIVKSI